MRDVLHNPIGLLLVIILSWFMLIAVFRHLGARRLNRELGLPIMFQPQNGNGLTYDGIRLEAVSDGELCLRYRVVNTTSRAIEIFPLLGGFSLFICGMSLQEGFPVPDKPFILLPGDSRQCAQTFLFSHWRKCCGLHFGQVLPENCMPEYWVVKDTTTGMTLTAVIENKEQVQQ